MTGFFWSLASFLVAIGILVTVHEFGHFWVARRLDVKVLRFSIGFGRPLWRREFGADRTELVIASVPLGGYVKMLDEREGEVAPAEALRAFNRKPLRSRAAIVVAGPLTNFLFAVLAYAAMYMIGVAGLKPVVGEIIPDTPAAEAGFQPGDLLTRVGGREVQTWEVAVLALLDHGLSAQEIEVEVRTADGRLYVRRLPVGEDRLLLEEGPLLDRLGIRPQRPRPDTVLAGVSRGGAAERAGLRAGDRLIAIEGERLDDWGAWVTRIRERPGQLIRMEIERDGRRMDLALTPEAVDEEGRITGRIGAWPRIDPGDAERLRSVVRYGPFEGVARGAQRTWDMTSLTLRVLWRLVTGEASLKNVSGPVGIAEYAGVSAAVGPAAFLAFLGIVSVSLGVLNLLPIPVLDGGHLLYYCIEAVKGSPLSEQAEEIGARIGFVLIGALMILAIYNDLTRLVTR